RCGSTARRDLCGGRPAMAVPTATTPNGISVQIIRAYFNMKALERVALLRKHSETLVYARGRVHRQRNGNCALRVRLQGHDRHAGHPPNGGLVLHAKALPTAIPSTAVCSSPPSPTSRRTTESRSGASRRQGP